MLPRNWNILIIDLKDCFFTIPLHPADAPRFAFSVPKINKTEPMDRYHWTVLPQRMKNSLTICQTYVAEALCPVRKCFPHVYIYHYMDDILLSSPTDNLTQEVLPVLRQEFQTWGLQIAPEKIQIEPPWKYLGWKILQHSIQPQNIAIKTEIRTLHDVQKLIGNINWIRTQCGIDNHTLAPLFELLKGDTNINAPRRLTNEARVALHRIEEKISAQQCQRRAENLPIQLYICNQNPQPLAIIAQWDSNATDPLLLLEWVFLPHQPTKTLATRIEMFSDLIREGRERIIEMAGEEPKSIIIPIVKDYLDWCLQNSLELQSALSGFNGQLDIHLPSHKMLTFYNNVHVEDKPLYRWHPVQGQTVFTDGSGRTGKAVVTWEQGGHWQHVIETIQGSPQIVELHAVVMAFKQWDQAPLNIVSDSHYAVGVAQRIERSQIKHIHNEALFLKFKELLFLTEHRTHPYCVIHIRSHMTLPGFFAEGNARADQLTNIALQVPVPNTLSQARLSHQFFHQAAKALSKQFAIPIGGAKLIVQTCPDCQQRPGPPTTVNPRGPLFSSALAN
uniref:ribonuclease H n=1 Tax=Anser cygnoides TaxID=8845 RepID=A0A8B9EKR5_ANSCY